VTSHNDPRRHAAVHSRKIGFDEGELRAARKKVVLRREHKHVDVADVVRVPQVLVAAWHCETAFVRNAALATRVTPVVGPACTSLNVREGVNNNNNNNTTNTNTNTNNNACVGTHALARTGIEGLAWVVVFCVKAHVHETHKGMHMSTLSM